MADPGTVADDQPAPAGWAPAAPGSRRPRTVTLAVALIAAQVAVYAVGLLTTAVNREELDRIVRALPADSAGFAPYIGILSLAIALIIVLAVAVVFSLLAVLNLQGNNAGRIVTVVLCFIGLGLALKGAVHSFGLEAPLPGWYISLQIYAALLNAALYAGIIELLCVPASRPHFKAE
jgi:hypothetical protein